MIDSLRYDGEKYVRGCTQYLRHINYCNIFKICTLYSWMFVKKIGDKKFYYAVSVYLFYLQKPTQLYIIYVYEKSQNIASNSGSAPFHYVFYNYQEDSQTFFFYFVHSLAFIRKRPS